MADAEPAVGAVSQLVPATLRAMHALEFAGRHISPTTLPQIRSGRVRALGVTSLKRATSLPDVPTIAEAGLPGYDAGVWYAVLAPAGTPKDVIGKLHGEIVRAATHPEMKRDRKSVV